ncbi:hypothetical protein NLJ89_g11595 [Agrocybe chaxingu]|uniref:Zn(2)-C6 fungal-type domain-containing protein n=1 Tax=Agrocybe chaxingu TaxID=84603 RepID=A0A9W8JW09_9AGAR|nr:hypothetical protein NLJ89_g11595 [Agrocybe chaxingu]
MSPRGSSAASPSTHGSRNSTTAPYTRRSSSQPKSSRQQFSACGACRMRRVRCDLKDLPINSLGPHPACSNCTERGIKCVDEFADVKAVKLLRRGRRLQQVEAIYGKVADQDGNSSSTSSASRAASIIPILHSDFFASQFWRSFVVQRPILDSLEFPARFAAHCKGTRLLGNEGGLIAMMLVTWAASFGLDERGMPHSEGSPVGPHGTPDTSGSDASARLGTSLRQRKNKTEAFLREIMELIDLYGVLRRPTLDGLRVLLLLLPLMEDGQPLERLAIHEATLSQVQALCVLSASQSSSFDDASVRARLFCLLSSTDRSGDDLETFQRTLPPLNFDMGPSPPSPPAIEHASAVGGYSAEPSHFSGKAFVNLMHAAATPLDLGNACRKIHTVLTGIKATRRAEDHGVVDAHGMREIWSDLDRCWQELDAMLAAPLDPHGNPQQRRTELRQFVNSWQIVIFECHNVIREALKQFITKPPSQAIYSASSPPRPSSSHSSNSSPYLSPEHLHGVASRRCLALLPRIVRIIQSHTARESVEFQGLFRWDAGLVRDGCFFAAYLAASVEGDLIEVSEVDSREGIDANFTVDEAVSACLDALSSMQWAYSKTAPWDPLRRRLPSIGASNHLTNTSQPRLASLCAPLTRPGGDPAHAPSY